LCFIFCVLFIFQINLQKSNVVSVFDALESKS
jgi:hypothetical protein